MAKAIAYNTLGTKQPGRIVSVFDATDMDDAVRIAANWNKEETRSNMQVNFIMIGSIVRPLAVIPAPLFD